MWKRIIIAAVRGTPKIILIGPSPTIPNGSDRIRIGAGLTGCAVWSGGSFVYVPPGVEVPLPLQAYFRINGENTGQFERTLIVVDEGASVHYIEGCTAPIYATESLHVAVVEVIAKPRSKVRYTTIQNWSNDVYNLVTKRAHAYEDSRVEMHLLHHDGEHVELVVPTHVLGA